MRTAVTIGYEHGTGKPVLLRGPDYPFSDQKDRIKDIKEDSHVLYERIEVWNSSGGICKSKSFGKPDAPKKTVAAEAAKEPKAKAKATV